MKKLKWMTFLVVILMVGCVKEEPITKQEQAKTNQEPLTGKQINQIIDGIIDETGSFSWLDVDDFVLWSAAMNGENILTIGYGQDAYSNFKSGELLKLKKEIFDLVVRFEKEKNPKLKSTGEDVLIYDDPILNFIDVRVANLETIKELRKNYPDIRYIEPGGYRYFDYDSKFKSSKGCTTSASSVNSADYRVISPNCLVPWTFDRHNIPAAWSYSTGSGIGVGLIDTGVSNYQSLLGSGFNDGYSSGRTIRKYGVYVDSFWPWSTKTDGYHDKCGHGTRMAATVASPRNNDMLPVGVAYNCNLVSYRATKNVVLDGYHEQKGVARALTELGNRSDIKIISMSIGHIFSVGRISDAVKYAYGKGKMIIAAGGTSTEWTNFVGVIFPASMNETVAVTGITDASGYHECAVCHKGSKIDFTVIMQRASNSERTSVTLGYYAGQKDYVGGSSVSTATTAGIAALIWARHPTWSRSQVLSKMRQSASLYPNKSSNFGYGSINALLAVQ
jgi:serine protease